MRNWRRCWPPWTTPPPAWPSQQGGLSWRPWGAVATTPSPRWGRWWANASSSRGWWPPPPGKGCSGTGPRGKTPRPPAGPRPAGPGGRGGAGPGDPGLIPFKGLQLLHQAQVVVYDRLVEKDLLKCPPRGAELIYAGKARGERAFDQEEINRTLIEKAREGKLVVRLKGGDPFVLGRGGEGAEALARAGGPL